MPISIRMNRKRKRKKRNNQKGKVMGRYCIIHPVFPDRGGRVSAGGKAPPPDRVDQVGA
jgi:hypothetical protein